MIPQTDILAPERRQAEVVREPIKYDKAVNVVRYEGRCLTGACIRREHETRMQHGEMAGCADTLRAGGRNHSGGRS